jgi:hypothetical protein
VNLPSTASIRCKPFAAVMDDYNAIIAALDARFKQIEAKKTADYRPLYLAASGKPNHDLGGPGFDGFF